MTKKTLAMSLYHFLLLFLTVILLGLAAITFNQTVSEPPVRTHAVESDEARPFQQTVRV